MESQRKFTKIMVMAKSQKMASSLQAFSPSSPNIAKSEKIVSFKQIMTILGAD